jgi:hypothetical protein
MEVNGSNGEMRGSTYVQEGADRWRTVHFYNGIDVQYGTTFPVKNARFSWGQTQILLSDGREMHTTIFKF